MFWSMIIALQAAPVLSDGQRFDPAASTVRVPLGLDRRCDADLHPDEVVVCGRNDDRFRLPLPVEHIPIERASGDSRGGLAAMTPNGACGIFAGERRCAKREAAQYGYGKGRDPITILTRLAKKVADPDAE